MDSTAENIYDLIGIGIGPFNLGLAALLKPLDSVKSIFFDKSRCFDWHRGMLLESSKLQVPFFADLVTMADPRSEFTFVNYLHLHDRLYRFCSLENFHIYRSEFNKYCQWVSERLDSLQFSSEVLAVDCVGDLFQVSVLNHVSGVVHRHMARNVVVGVGTVPHLPKAALEVENDGTCLHSSDYLYRKEEIQRVRDGIITVIGSGQSAAEIFLDLLESRSGDDFRLNWLTQSGAFSAMEYSKLGVEHFTPSYVEYFYRLSEKRKSETLASQKHWYKGISVDTINQIYECLYRKSVDGDEGFVIQARSKLRDIRRKGSKLRLSFEHLDRGSYFELLSDYVILATGYQYEFPACLAPMHEVLVYDTDGRVRITKNYSLEMTRPMDGRIYVQNMEIHSHGAAAPDLGLGAFRAAAILNSVLGRECYPVGKRKVFQTFGISEQFQTSSVSERIQRLGISA